MIVRQNLLRCPRLQNVIHTGTTISIQNIKVIGRYYIIGDMK